MIVLLSAIVTSFLSSARTEHTATRNYTSKTRAEQFASSATQQAMAKIQQGFTVNGTGTTVITTQPGAITQFVFTNGNITSPTPVISGNAITYPPTASLFSGTGNASTNGTANLNNLQSPSSNATLTSNSTNNRWTITGNASEQINVPMENITSNGTIVGRIAYYVDDELTKININAATANRSTLNVADSRSLSLTTLSNNTTTLTNFLNSINGASTDASKITNWGYFFRPEQATANGSSALNLSPSDHLPFLTALPPREFHTKYTPWGARRFFINDTTEVPLNSAGVNKTVAALSDQHLRNIYGQTFADKYTPTGLKQIAANMLQYRSKDTMRVGESLAFTGNLIGSDNLDADGIPKEYLGLAPYPYINQVGVSGRLAVQANATATDVEFRIIFQICVECAMHMQTAGNFYGGGNSWSDPSDKKAQIVVELDSVSYAVDYQYPTGNSTASGSWSGGGSWGAGNTGVNFTQFWGSGGNSTYRQNFGYYDHVNDFPVRIEKTWYPNANLAPFVGDGYGSDSALNGSQNQDWIPNAWLMKPFGSGAYSLYSWIRDADYRMIANQSSLAGGHRYHMGTLGRKDRQGEIAVGFSVPFSSNITVTDIRDVKVKIKSVKILADGSNPKSIRDWVIGQDLPADFPVPVVTNFQSSLSAAGSPLVSFDMSCKTVGGGNVTLNDHTSSSINNTFTLNGSSKSLIFNGLGANASVLPNISVASSNITVSNPRTWNAASSYHTLVWPLPVPAPTENIHRNEPVLKRPSSLTTLPWESGNITLWSDFGKAPWSGSTNSSNEVARGHSNGKNVFGFGYTLRKSLDAANASGTDFHGEFQGSSFMGDPSDWENSTHYSQWTANLTIPGDPRAVSTTDFFTQHFYGHSNVDTNNQLYPWPYYNINSSNSGVFTDSNGDNLFLIPADLGKINTNYPYRRLRMQVQPSKEVASTMGGTGNGSSSLIPDWAMLDVISFGSNTTTLPYNFATPVNMNAKFATHNGTLTANRSVSLRALLSPFDNTTANSTLARNPYNLTGNFTANCTSRLVIGIGGSWTGNQSTLLANSIGNVTWSTASKWGSNNSTSVRSSRKFPSGQIVLPSEVVEIANVSDFLTINQADYTSRERASATTSNSTQIRNLKLNEFRLSSFFPGSTTCSNFFTIYAYAQAGQLQNKAQPESASNPFIIDSEALTKTLVEVEIITPASSNGTTTTPATYKVKKLYTQPIPMGE